MELLLITAQVLIGCMIVVGIALNLVAIPGNWVVLLMVVISNLLRDDPLSWAVLAAFTLVTIVSTVIDNFTIGYGAKKMGAGKWGVVGAFIGMFVGLFAGGIIGVIIGPFIGAVVAELVIEKKEMKSALKSGFGTFVGFIAALLLKFGAGVAMFAYWLISF